MPPRVCVIGAGIMGMSSAVLVQRTFPHLDITIMADLFSPHTTSDGSGGKWKPHPSMISHLHKKWLQTTFDHQISLFNSPDANDIGIQLVSGYDFLERNPNPIWKDIVLGFRPLTQQEIEAVKPRAKYGIFYTTFVLNCKQYLPWLMRRFRRNGGKIIYKRLDSIEEVAKEYDIIINCAGLRAGQLVGDKSVYPTRGQTTQVHAPWVRHFYSDYDETEKLTIIPCCDGDVLLGGTSQNGRWDTEVDQEDKERILRGCMRLVPSLQNAKVIADLVGLRPSRPMVRLELEEFKLTSKRAMVIHNYGHGGSGISLHWGCAQDVVDLVKEVVKRMSPYKSKL